MNGKNVDDYREVDKGKVLYHTVDFLLSILDFLIGKFFSRCLI